MAKFLRYLFERHGRTRVFLGGERSLKRKRKLGEKRNVGEKKIEGERETKPEIKRGRV